MTFVPPGSDGDGPMGPAGKDGKDGLSGKDGINGRDGAKGEQGPTGKNGLDGTSGRDGKDGKDGAPGTNGLPGKDGAKGDNGAPGNDGKNGDKGKDAPEIPPDLILPAPYFYRKNAENKLEIAKKDIAAGTDRTVFVIGSLSTDHFDFWEAMGGMRYQKPDKGEFNALRMSPSGDGLSVTVGNYLCDEGTIIATSYPGTTQLRIMDEDRSGKSGYAIEFGDGASETSTVGIKFDWLVECPRGLEFLMRILTVTLLEKCHGVAYNITIRHPKTDEMYYSMQNLEAWNMGEYDPDFMLSADTGEVALSPDIPMPLLREERLVISLLLSKPIELKSYEDAKYGMTARSTVRCLFLERSTLVGCVKGIADSDMDQMKLLPATFVKERDGANLRLWTGEKLVDMDTVGEPIDYNTLMNMLNNLDAKSVDPQFLNMEKLAVQDSRLLGIGRNMQFLDPETKIRYTPVSSSIWFDEKKRPIYGHPCYWYPHEAEWIEPWRPVDLRYSNKSHWQFLTDTPQAVLGFSFATTFGLDKNELANYIVTVEQGRNVTELVVIHKGSLTGARLYQPDPYYWAVDFMMPSPAMITVSERDTNLHMIQLTITDADGNGIMVCHAKSTDEPWAKKLVAPLTKELIYHSGIKEELFNGMTTRQYKVTGFLQGLVKGTHATGQIRWPEGVNPYAVIGVSVSIWGEGVPDPAVRTTERKELATWNAVGAQTEFTPGIAKVGMPWTAIITVDNTSDR